MTTNLTFDRLWQALESDTHEYGYRNVIEEPQRYFNYSPFLTDAWAMDLPDLCTVLVDLSNEHAAGKEYIGAFLAELASQESWLTAFAAVCKAEPTNMVYDQLRILMEDHGGIII